MNAQTTLKKLMTASYHKGGLKCLKLFKLQDDFFKRLKKDVENICEKWVPSEVAYKGHVTKWTNPFGRAIQYSLLNTSGKFDDTSSDHAMTLLNKKFHHSEEYKALAAFIGQFGHAYNFRLNGMGPNGGLSPHEEHIVVPKDVKSLRKHYTCRARFHMPVFTNKKTEMLLDEEIFWFEPGYVYLFNNGCVHSAANHGEDFRYHLVWDMLMTQETYDMMFSDQDTCDPQVMEKIKGEARRVSPVRSEAVKEYAVQAGYGSSKPLYRKLRLEKFGVQSHSFHKLYNEWRHFKHGFLGKLELDEVR